MEPTNFGNLFWRPLALFPDRVAIEQDDTAITYRQLEQRTQRAANLLSALGVGKGERVLLLFPNDYRFAECLFGTLRTGASAIPANIKLGAQALVYIAEHSEARVLIGHASLLDKIDIVREAVPDLQVLLVDGKRPDTLSYDTLHAEADGRFESVDVDPARDEALLMYTSGSTGHPKGCLLSHANKWWQARSTARTMILDEEDKALVFGPLYHANALWACMLPMMYVGGTISLLPGFDAAEVIVAIDRYRPTYISGTPSMFTLLLSEKELLEQYDTSSIELLICGSAPVPEELLLRLKAQFDCELVESYGLTEGGANVMTPRWGVKKLGSTGLPVPDVEVRVVDPQDPQRECAPGEVGELWSRAPANALGYLKQPEFTAQKFTPDGWLRTGDLVKYDEQGYIYISGRVDDMINCGGENVYPKEVETILLTHPGIADACVVKVPHETKGEAPIAWVVPRKGSILSEEEVRSYFLANGPAYAHPRRVFLVEELPLSGTNKIDRKWLEEKAQQRVPGGLRSGGRRLSVQEGEVKA
jgi:long-chain acyl-CoA synthetase